MNKGLISERPERQVVQDADLSLGQRLAAEGELFRSAPASACQAYHDEWRRLQDNPTKLAQNVGASVALGCAFGILSRNPALVGETLAPAVALVQRYGAPALFGISVVDISAKTAVPIATAWTSPDSIADTKTELGQNLGKAAFDYSLSGITSGGGFIAGRHAASHLEWVQSTRVPAAFCFATAKSVALLEHPKDADLLQSGILQSRKFDATGLPATIRLSGKATESKFDTQAEHGDILIGQREIASKLAMRFVTQVNTGTNRWINIDLWQKQIQQALHGMNVFHLNEKKPFLSDLIKNQAGKEAYLNTGKLTDYKLRNGILIPEGYRQSELPKSLTCTGDIYNGSHRPLHDAQSVPAAGNIWLKFEDNGKSIINHQQPTKIIPFVSTGELYHRFHLPELSNSNFESVRSAEQGAAYLKAFLAKRAGDPIVLEHGIYRFQGNAR
jgi:hypothetical protein